MQVRAIAKRLPVSAQKVRLVADQVRGRRLAAALDLLHFSDVAAAALVRKVLESAIANAENNEGADVDELRIAEIQVNEGTTFKRIRPRAKGRANRIFKRTSQVAVRLSDE